MLIRRTFRTPDERGNMYVHIIMYVVSDFDIPMWLMIVGLEGTVWIDVDSSFVVEILE